MHIYKLYEQNLLCQETGQTSACFAKCFENALHAQVAVKVITLPPGADFSDPLVLTLRRELLVVIHAASSCPHLCRYLGVTIKGSSVLIVMQKYEKSLADVIKSDPGG